MGLKRIALALVVCAWFTGSAFAASVTGQVINGTNDKPSAGDEVVILSLSQGMTEIGRTKTDASGKFKVEIPDDGTPHMVRVNHQGVNYFPKGGPLMPGATTVEIQVFDNAKKLSLTTAVNVMRVQADSGTMNVVELYAVENHGEPPRTMFDPDKTYEFTLPDGAILDAAAAQPQDGQPVNSAALPQKEKNHYAMIFPLRPGETRFQITYHLPYKGNAGFTPKLLTPMQHYVVMFPKSMKFAATRASAYAPMNDDTGAGIQVASDVKPGDDLSFQLSGTETIRIPARVDKVRLRSRDAAADALRAGRASRWRLRPADCSSRSAGALSLGDSWSAGSCDAARGADRESPLCAAVCCRRRE